MSGRQSPPMAVEMSVTCARCSETWPRDPALEVACPECRAPIGRWCKRPSEHRAPGLHAGRDRAAMEMGLLKKCAGPVNEAREGDLFA